MKIEISTSVGNLSPCQVLVEMWGANWMENVAISVLRGPNIE